MENGAVAGGLTATSGTVYLNGTVTFTGSVSLGTVSSTLSLFGSATEALTVYILQGATVMLGTDGVEVDGQTFTVGFCLRGISGGWSDPACCFGATPAFLRASVRTTFTARDLWCALVRFTSSCGGSCRSSAPSTPCSRTESATQSSTRPYRFCSRKFTIPFSATPPHPAQGFCLS